MLFIFAHSAIAIYTSERRRKMGNDAVAEWHELLEDLEHNHRQLARRVRDMIRDYEKLYGVGVSLEYDGGEADAVICSGGTTWEVDTRE
jgi:hypothetical protein